MPTCRDMSELVTDYMEHAAPLRLRLDMWWHLARCTACRRYFDQVRRTVRLLGKRFPTPPAQTTEDGVVAAARGQLPREQ
jgi:predicted anti-sigma-YlaC factor YlaD